jgi:5'-phosphate synthase pdxT subunit
MFRRLDIETRRIRFASELAEVDGLVLPGGESTTMLKTATPGLWDALREFAQTHAVWGICAGCIVVAAEVTNPQQDSLGIVDIDVERNSYGAQNESFIRGLDIALPRGNWRGEAIFIRSPRITRTGAPVSVLAACDNAPVMVTQGRHLVTVFHPELGADPAVHQFFVDTLVASG